MSPNTPPIRWAVALILALAATACGLSQAQRHAVSEFSASTGTLSDLVASELLSMRASVIAMNQQGVELISREGRYDFPKQGPEEAFTAEAVAARTSAAHTLRSYGDLLGSLVDDSQKTELDAASQEFAQNVRGLMGPDRKLTDEQLGVIAGAVSAVGGLIVESKKATAVERIVKETHPQIAHLGSLLADDFDPKKDGKLASQVVLTTERLLVAGDTAASTPQTESQPAAARAASLRAAGVRALWLGRESRAHTASITASVSAAVRQMMKANDELLKSIESGDVSIQDVKDLATRVRGLASLVQAMR